MENCIFCKISKKEIPSSVIYEDGQFLAFLDIKPVSKGHLLLIPKTHYVWMTDAPDEIIANIYIKAKELMIHMKDVLQCDYVQMSVVGKDVPHFHIHLMPRYFNDSLPMWPETSYSTSEEISEYVSKLKMP